MRKTIALAMLVPLVAACNGRPPGRQDSGGAQSPSSSPQAAARTHAAKAGVKIDVKLKRNSSGICVPEDPLSTEVSPGETVRWKFKNQCQQGKKKQKIDPKTAPISGNCKNVTEVEDGQENEGGDCTVDEDAAPGTYKYKIDGDAVLDPELVIPQPPPPPGGTKPTPTPTPEAK